VTRATYLRAVRSFAHGNQPLPGVERSSGEFPSVEITFEPPNASRRPQWFPSLLRVMSEPQACEVENVIVHGSWGDGTAIAYSDLDVTLALSQAHMSDPVVVARTQRWIDYSLFPFLVSVDAQQHHGPFLLWPGYREAYSERVLPLATYQDNRAWSIRKQTLRFTLTEDPVTGEPESLRCARRLANAKDTFFRYGFDRYSFKRMVSNATLLPAYFMGDIGLPTTKSLSFEQFYSQMGEEVPLIRLAESIRAGWEPPSVHFSKTAQRLARSAYAYRGIHAITKTPGRTEAKLLAKLAAELIPLVERRFE